MQSLGGKLISSQRKAAALSTEAYALMEAGDEATLLDVAESIEAAAARALTILCDFSGIDLPSSPGVTTEGRAVGSRIVVEMNKEFVRSDLTARELRAIQALYTGGLIPLDVLYYALRSVNVIPVEYSLEDFRRLMDDPSQLYTDKAGERARKESLRNKVEVARISAHVDEPAYQPIAAPGAPAPEPAGPAPGGGNNPARGTFP